MLEAHGGLKANGYNVSFLEVRLKLHLDMHSDMHVDMHLEVRFL